MDEAEMDRLNKKLADLATEVADKSSTDATIGFFLSFAIGALAQYVGLDWSEDRHAEVVRAIVARMEEEKATGKKWEP